MMKRLVTLTAVLAATFVLCGCEDGGDGGGSNADVVGIWSGTVGDEGGTAQFNANGTITGGINGTYTVSGNHVTGSTLTLDGQETGTLSLDVSADGNSMSGSYVWQRGTSGGAESVNMTRQ